MFLWVTVMQKNILIVEDEMVIALDLKYQVEADPAFSAEVVASGEEAISRISSKKFELILMDVKLKGKLNGIETANIIRSQNDTPIIFITGNSDLIKSKEVQNTKPEKILIKPVIGTELMDTIINLLK